MSGSSLTAPLRPAPAFLIAASAGPAFSYTQRPGKLIAHGEVFCGHLTPVMASLSKAQPILLNVPPFWRPGLLPYHHSGRCSCIIACPIARLRFLQPMVKCRHPWKVSRPQWPPSMPCVGSSSRDATLTPMSQVTLELPRTRLLASCPSLLPLKTCGPVGCSRLIACSLFGVTRTLPDWHGSPPSCGAAPETPAFLHYKEPP